MADYLDFCEHTYLSIDEQEVLELQQASIAEVLLELE